jgi:[protein-PII] uridylyltransferase
VLSLQGLDVLGAEAHSDEQGMAASEFRVNPPDHGTIDWDRIETNLHKALHGELALDARLAEREATYRPPRATTAIPPSPPTVRIDNTTSTGSTFVEVRAPDRVGVLHRITKALAEVGLDIRHARVQTLGNEVVDTFYVRTLAGAKVSDEEHQREVTRAILFALT